MFLFSLLFLFSYVHSFRSLTVSLSSIEPISEYGDQENSVWLKSLERQRQESAEGESEQVQHGKRQNRGKYLPAGDEEECVSTIFVFAGPIGSEVGEIRLRKNERSTIHDAIGAHDSAEVDAAAAFAEFLQELRTDSRFRFRLLRLNFACVRV